MSLSVSQSLPSVFGQLPGPLRDLSHPVGLTVSGSGYLWDLGSVCLFPCVYEYLPFTTLIFKSIYLFIYLFVRACMRACAIEYAWRSEHSLQELLLSLHYVSPGTQTQVIQVIRL